MISRRTAIAIGGAYAQRFRNRVYDHHSGRYEDGIYTTQLYEFLFEREHNPWLCNQARQQTTARGLKEFVMRLHTGESLLTGAQEWTWAQRQARGQQWLQKLGVDILNDSAGRQAPDAVTHMLRSLELDGYVYRDSRLLVPEIDILDAGEEAGVLQDLYGRLGLGEQDTFLHHLRLCSEHYEAGRWDDSIGQSRKVLECALQEVARAYSNRTADAPLNNETYESAGGVRDYLCRHELIEERERDTIKATYQLLSDTGGHPRMARPDQARLLRNLSLTLSQFVLLRYEGILAGAG